MKSSCLVLIALAASADATALLSSTKGCGPQVQVCLADTTDAAGAPQYSCKVAGSIVLVGYFQVALFCYSVGKLLLLT